MPCATQNATQTTVGHGTSLAQGVRAGVDLNPAGDASPVGFDENVGMAQQVNVLGTELQPCSFDPITGYYRTGCCENRGDDPGMHTVCCRVTDDFLAYSREQGNDLSTPMPQFGFAGLVDGDQWCVCADRWKDALDAGRACPVVLESTHMSTLEYVDLADLRSHALTA